MKPTLIKTECRSSKIEELGTQPIDLYWHWRFKFKGDCESIQYQFHFQLQQW